MGKKTVPSTSNFHIYALLGLFLSCVVVFGKTIEGDYLTGWDDDQQVVNNTDVTNLNTASIKNYFTKFYVASYQPMASLSFGIEYAIFGKKATVHHITNLLLHILNVFLVFYLLEALFKEKWLTLIVSLFFAIHPFQLEVLGWISTRSTLLYALFLLYASFIYVRHVQHPEQRKSWQVYLVVFFLFLCACFTKSAAIVFPFWLILLNLFITRKNSKQLWVSQIPFIALSIVFGLISIKSRHSGGDTFREFYGVYDLTQHVLIRGRTLYFYLIEPFYQSVLHIFRPFPLLKGSNSNILIPSYYTWQSILSFVAIIALGITAFIQRKNRFGGLIIFALCWFFVNLGLHLNIFAVSAIMIAERYLYLPSIALGILLYALIQIIVSKFPQLQKGNFQYYVLIPIFLFYGFTAHNQVKHWKNSKALFTHDIPHTDHYYSSQQLGRIYHKEGNLEKSLEVYNNYIKINPHELKMYLYRALLINDLGDFDYAQKDLYRILDLRSIASKSKIDNKMLGQAFYHLGLIWKDKNSQRSMLYLDSAIQLGNEMAIVEKLSGTTIGDQDPASNTNMDQTTGDISPAQDEVEGNVFELVPAFLVKKDYKTALEYVELMFYIAPDSAISYNYKAQCLRGLGKLEDSKRVLNEAIIGKKMHTGALYYLRGLINEDLKNHNDACSDYFMAKSLKYAVGSDRMKDCQ